MPNKCYKQKTFFSFGIFKMFKFNTLDFSHFELASKVILPKNIKV